MEGGKPSSYVPHLQDYDRIIVSSSGGKDSQTALAHVVDLALEHQILDRVSVLHCDLGHVEWPGSRELAEVQAMHHGLSCEVVRHPKSLLQLVAKRGKWPDSKNRFCTSYLKRDQAQKVYTRAGKEVRKAGPLDKIPRILSVMGMRAQESPARSKLKPFVEKAPRVSNTVKQVDIWLPIHHLSLDDVWADIGRRGVPHHYAYDLGMPRLSCVFCIFSPREALMLAGKHNRPLLDECVELEQRIDHTFRSKLSLLEIQQALDAGEEVGEVSDWTM